MLATDTTAAQAAPNQTAVGSTANRYSTPRLTTGAWCLRAKTTPVTTATAAAPNRTAATCRRSTRGLIPGSSLPGGRSWAPTRSFLKSGPGLLTAAASLVAAVAGLVTALTQLGGGRSEPSAAAPAATPTNALADASERELQIRIPAMIWPTCMRPTDAEATAVAAFNCSYRTIVRLQYNLFATSREMDADFRSVRRRYGLENAPGRSCPAGRFAGRDGGRSVLCFVDRKGHIAAIVWTRPSAAVVSFAWRD